MALGTITINKVIKTGNSPVQVVDMSIQGDDSYPTGGTTGAEATLRAALEAGDGLAGSLSNLDLLAAVKADGLIDSDAHYDAGNDTLVVRDGDGAQKANASDQSGETYRLLTFWA